MLILLFSMAVAIVLLWPDTIAGRALRRLMIEQPARKVAQITPGTALFALLVMLVIAVVIGVAKRDGVALLAQGVPEGIAWFATFDVATYIDVIALAWLLAATVRLRAAYGALTASVARAKRLTTLWLSGLRVRGKSGARRRARRCGQRAPRPSPDQDEVWPALAA